MKKVVNKMTIASLLVLACVTLFSFSKMPGGDSFQVYLNGKLLLDKALYRNKEIQNLELLQASPNDKVEIYYSHCGITGTDRTITAKNEQQKVLKTWRFADASGKKMSLLLQDLKDLQAKGGNIALFYSSKELPAGQELASVSINSKSLAAN